MRTPLPILLLLSVGCNATLSDPGFATGSHTIVADADAKAVYTVDGDNGAVVRQDTVTGAISTLTVGAEPARIARIGSTLYVTLQGERSIAIIEDQGGKMVLKNKVQTGTEPIGIVAAESGKTLYVALSTQDEVQELDASTLAVLRTWSIEGQPTWLALKPGGKALYVASAYGGHLNWVNLESGEVAPIKLRHHTGAGENKDQPLTLRLTGDLWVSGDGETLAVPELLVDNTTPVEDLENIDVASGGGYASTPSLSVSRFNPGIELIPLGSNGTPGVEDSTTLFVAGFGLDNTVRSYVNSVTISPDGLMVLATMEASNTVVAASAIPIYKDASRSSFGISDTGGFIDPADANFASPPMSVISTDAGPRGVAFVGDEAYLQTFLARTVGPLWSAQASRDIGEQFAMGSVSATARAAPRGTSFGDSTLPADVLAGRQLFYSATSSVMAADGAGVSCSTCHYQGRNDGLTWSFRSGGRQTPSLAGHVTATAPFTWTSEVPSIADEATLTSQGRMGGDGLTRSDAENIQAFVDFTRPVDLPLKNSTDAAVLRGKAIYEREDVGCSSCHGGTTLSDNLSHPMFGLTAANTPSLVGVAATAPYLHDGSAPTLKAVLEASRGGEMGNTGMLSEAEMADLEMYLKSL